MQTSRKQLDLADTAFLPLHLLGYTFLPTWTPFSPESFWLMGGSWRGGGILGAKEQVLA